jgi:hypothetical protein
VFLLKKVNYLEALKFWNWFSSVRKLIVLLGIISWSGEHGVYFLKKYMAQDETGYSSRGLVDLHLS